MQLHLPTTKFGGMWSFLGDHGFFSNSLRRPTENQVLDVHSGDRALEGGKRGLEGPETVRETGSDTWDVRKQA